jgi:hypothetical protein
MLNRDCLRASSTRHTTGKIWGCIELRNELREVDWLKWQRIKDTEIRN